MPKPLLVHGGAGFARSVIATGEVDEFRLITFPVALGKGLAIFDCLPKPLRLTPVAATTYPNGVIAKVFHPAPAPTR